jgi:branched-chain amino acid aminotransferase
LTVNTEGYVAEGSGDNVFVVKRGAILTPPTYIGALRGITRDFIIQIAREEGYEVREEPFTRHDVYVADEVFLTGTAAEMIPVVKVDGRVIGNGRPGVITGKLLELFRKRVVQEGTKIYAQSQVG